MRKERKTVILNVDDVDAVRYGTTRVLKKAGFEVWEAASGREALNKAQDMPDLVILNVNLPDISGFEVCKRIKSDPAKRNIPVLYLSATYTGTKKRITDLDYGADGYLVQPVEPDELIAHVRVLLRIKEAEKTASWEAKQWHLTFDAANDAICTLDREQKIQRCNKAFSRLLGKESGDITGRHCWELIHGTQEPIPECPITRMKKSLRREYMELAIDRNWFLVTVDPILDEAGVLAGGVHTLHDITERKQAEETLRKSEERFKQITESAGEWIWEVDSDGLYTFSSPVIEKLLGYTPEEIVGKKHFYDLFIPEEREYLKKIALETFARREPFKRLVNPNLHKNGYIVILETSGLPIIDEKGNLRGYRGADTDITERKQVELREKLAREVLELMNRPEDSTNTVREILLLIRNRTGFDAVGIRLQKGDDFPYYETNGFSEDFVLAESSLCALDEEGKIIRDGQGNPVLECMCGNILCGRTNPALPFFTEGGSFWTNCTTDLLASTTEEDRHARTRNRCNGEGYESVALIPLRSGNNITGLLQLNDRRRNQFTPEMISFFEGIGASIGITIYRKQAEEEYKTILRTAIDGFWVVDIQGRFLDANDAYCRLIGYRRDEMLTMRISDIEAVETPGETAQRIKKIMEVGGDRFETRHRCKDGRIVDVEVSVNYIDAGGGRLFVFARDITVRKLAKDVLRRTEENFRRSLEESPLGVRIVTAGGETIYANRAILDIYGYDNIEELKTTPVKKRYTQGSYAEFQIRREKRKQGDDVLSKYEVSIVRKDGEVRQFQAYRKAIIWDGEKQFQVIYQDITERKREGEGLRASREQLRSLAGRLQAAREAERTRIAREIHDELGGALTGLKIDFSLLTRAALKIENETVRTSLLAGMGSMIKSIDATIHTVRRIAMELRPGVLDDLGLVAALEWQLKDFEKRTGIRCEFFPPAENISLDADFSTALFRIFQEALTNVARHSGATEVRVRLRADADSSTLEVKDNGRGIEKEKTMSSKSLGLLGMRERAQIFGGRFTVTGTPGRGTKVTVEISPVEKRKVDRDQGGDAG